MKEQKKIIFHLTAILVLCSILGILLEWECDKYIITWHANTFTGHRSFAVSIFVGVCTGSLLSLCTAWINYTSEKEKFIAEFSNLVEDFYTVCSKLQYLYIRGDVDLLVAYYCEESVNKKLSGTSERHTAKDRLLRSYKEKDPECNEYMRLIEDTDMIESKMDSVIGSYYTVSSFDFSKIERMLKKKSFILPNSKKSKQIETVYSYINKLYSDIANKVEYWKDFDATYNLIAEICRFQPQVFADLERYGGAVFLPPKNKAVDEIKELLSTLNQ